MGEQKDYIEEGGFSRYLYYQDGEIITASNGVSGKIVKKINGTKFDGLPLFSKTSEVYFKTDENGEIIQARIYQNRKPVCDFDWGHPHTNKRTKEKFEKGVVHVQTFKQDAHENWKRENNKARYMSNEEMDRYGELLKRANSNVKLRP